MKRPNIILLFLMILACCASRHKEKEFDKTDPVVSEVTPTVSTYQAVFSWQVDLPGKFQTAVEVSKQESMANFIEEGAYTIIVDNVPEEGGSVSGGGTYNHGASCTVIATEAEGYSFSNWTENGTPVSYDANYTFIVNSDHTLVANFTPLPPNTYNINVSPNPSDGGTVIGGGTYTQGQQCTVTASANSGYTFTNWTENGEVVSSNANYSFPVERDRVLVANFSVLPPNNYSINVSANPSQGGTVTGGGTYQQGQQCTVTATAAAGYNFLRWTENGNLVSENPIYQFTVTGSRTLVAQFQLINYNINVSANPSQGGTVTGGGTYQQGQQCTVTATAAAGYNFLRWTENGNLVTENPIYQFTVTGSRTLVAQFQLINYNINVSADPTNGGSVTGSGAFHYNDTITVSATANAGFSFTNWTENGNVVSSDLEYTFIVNSNRTLVANFTPLPPNTYNINVSPNPSDGGTVTGGGTYTYGQQCTVEATANPGYTFKKWTENGNLVSTEANFRFYVTGSRTLVAQFQQQNYTITASADPVNGGTVTGDGTYAYGVTCILTATPNEGYTFEHWKKGNTIVSTEFVHSFEVTENASFTANFKPIHQYSITATAEPEEGGTVTGYGTYAYGITCILTATPNEGYTFDHWKKGNTIFSTELVHSFEVTENASFIANFKPILVPHYTISVSANPTDWGEVYIGDSIGTTESTFAQGKYCTVHAEANDGYTFINWTEDDSVVSNDKDFQFKVTSNRILIANFKEIPCIELKDIEAKKHKTQYNDMVVLILVYPEAGYKYQWLRSDEENGDYTEIPGVTGQYYYKKGGIEEGYYKVRITKGECELVTEKPYKVQYPLKQLRIYPNPSRRDHNIVVVNDSDGPSQLSIYSTDGRLLHAQTVTDSQTTINLNLPSGVYIAYLTDSEGCTKVGKLIIQ